MLILLIAISACSKRTSSFERNEQNNNKNDLHSTSSAETNKETQPKPAAEHEGTIPNIDEKNASKQEAASLSEADEQADRRRRLNMYFPMDVLATILTGRAPECSKANKESPEEEKKRKERMEAWGREVKAKNLGPTYDKDLVIPGY